MEVKLQVCEVSQVEENGEKLILRKAGKKESFEIEDDEEIGRADI